LSRAGGSSFRATGTTGGGRARLVRREFLERSQGIVESIDELVGDLLELSRLESETLGLELQPIAISEVGSRIVELLAPVALDRGVELLSDLPPRMRTAIGDRRRMEQILTNLTGNAVKFTASGGSIEVRGWFDGPIALLVVRDCGGRPPGGRRLGGSAGGSDARLSRGSSRRVFHEGVDELRIRG
jgi:signal transduction histidine kinase